MYSTKFAQAVVAMSNLYKVCIGSYQEVIPCDLLKVILAALDRAEAPRVNMGLPFVMDGAPGESSTPWRSRWEGGPEPGPEIGSVLGAFNHILSQGVWEPYCHRPWKDGEQDRAAAVGFEFFSSTC